MVRPNYKKLKSNIPNKVHVKKNKSYEVVWVDNLKSASGINLWGETRFNPDQIALNSQQSDKEVVFTMTHEFIHAIDDAYGIGLTEKQVCKLERSFQYLREYFLTIELGHDKIRKK